MFKRLLIYGGVLLTLLAAVLFVRASALDGVQVEKIDTAVPAIDAERAVASLSAAITFRTISRQDGFTEGDEAQFAAFNAWLTERYPLVHGRLERTAFGAGALFTWPGQDRAAPGILLMAHSDVVPIEPGTEGEWEHPPFSGAVADGFVWGRGALDDKGNLIAILEAAECLLAQDFQPPVDICFAFGHDEEVGGALGATRIAQHLRTQERTFAFIRDEGLPVTEGVVPGIDGKVIGVAVAEKGYVTLEMIASAESGHSSMPPERTAVGALSRAIAALEDEPFAPRYTAPTIAASEALAPHLGTVPRVLIANRWLFESLLLAEMTKSHAVNATLRTTIAPTMLEASVKENVLPSTARAVVNFRTLPGDTTESVVERVRATIADSKIEVRVLSDWNSPPPPSDTTSPIFLRFASIASTVYDDAIVMPGLLAGATDSRHYTGLSDSVYRFSPVVFGPDDIARIHGTNERRSVLGYAQAVRFFVMLMRDFTP